MKYKTCNQKDCTANSRVSDVVSFIHQNSITGAAESWCTLRLTEITPLYATAAVHELHILYLPIYIENNFARRPCRPLKVREDSEKDDGHCMIH